MYTVVAGHVCRDDIRHSGVDVDIVYYIYWGCIFFSQRAFGVKMMSDQRRCDVITSHQR